MQAQRLARALEETQARRVALEQTIAEQRAQLATVVQQLHSFTEARQRQAGVTTPFMPGGRRAASAKTTSNSIFARETAPCHVCPGTLNSDRRRPEGGFPVQRPSLLEGIGIALLASLVISPLLTVLRLGFGAIMAWKATLAMMACAYIVYLLARRGSMAGRTILALIQPARVPGQSRLGSPLAHPCYRGHGPGVGHSLLCLQSRALCPRCCMAASASWAWGRHSGPMRQPQCGPGDLEFLPDASTFPFLPTRLGRQAQQEQHARQSGG